MLGIGSKGQPAELSRGKFRYLSRGKFAIRYWRLAIGCWRFYFRLSQGVRSRLILLSRNHCRGTHPNREFILLNSPARPDFYSTKFSSRARIPTIIAAHRLSLCDNNTSQQSSFHGFAWRISNAVRTATRRQLSPARR